jgi:hypothetical protein
MTAFGADSVLTCLVASGFLTVSVFFFIPGAQAEFVEFSRRFNVVPRHVVYTCILAVVGGVCIGGWVFLSNAYALGGDTIKCQWAFQQNWYFRAYNNEVSQATSEMLRSTAGQQSAGMAPSTWGYVLAGIAAAGVSVARQIFPGLWFHPIGIILGSTYFTEMVWGSVFVAWIVRGLVVWIGGASVLRRGLLPLAVGIFLGGVASILFFNVVAAYLRSQGIVLTYGELP